MANLTNYPYPTYESNRPAAAVLAGLIGISLIAWLIQSIQSHFKPLRVSILLLVAHLTICIELILRAVLSTDTRNSRAAFTTTTVLLTVGQRTIPLSNYDFLTQVGDSKSFVSPMIVRGSMLFAISSAILMIPAGITSYNPNTIDISFQLRQASAAIVLCLTILFYPVWVMSKTTKDMTKQAIVLLIVSSITCLIGAVYLMIISVPYYYVGANEDEQWFYIFQFTPIAIALLTWTILHPRRSLKPVESNVGDTHKLETL